MNKKKFTRRDILGCFLGTAAGMPLLGYSSRQKPVSLTDDNLEKGMYAVITGSGSALPDPQRGNAGAAIVVDGTILQFDCGSRTMENLMLAGINPVDVDYIIFTHLHHDHVATYDYFIMTSWIAGRRKPFKVLGPNGTVNFSEGALYGKMALHVSYSERQGRGKPPVDVKEIGPGLVVEEKNFKVTATEVAHWGKTEGTRTLGYRVDSPYGSVVISGDTGPTQKIVDLAKGVDLLIHECCQPDAGMQIGGEFSKVRETQKEIDLNNPRTGHTSPSELGIIAQRAQVKKLVATHLPPYRSVGAAVEMSSKYYGNRQPLGIWTELISAVKKNFEGSFIVGEDALVIEIGKP